MDRYWKEKIDEILEQCRQASLGNEYEYIRSVISALEWEKLLILDPEKYPDETDQKLAAELDEIIHTFREKKSIKDNFASDARTHTDW